MADLFPPVGWDGQPLPVLLSVPSDDDERRDLHELLWPARTPLPRVGDTLTRQVYVHSDTAPTRVKTLGHLVLRLEWQTRPGHGAQDHPMLYAVVLVLGMGDDDSG